MGKRARQQLDELLDRAREKGDSLLEAVVRNKLEVNDVVRGFDTFIETRGVCILKGALGMSSGEYSGEKPPQEIADLWQQIERLDRFSDDALDLVLERTKEQT